MEFRIADTFTDSLSKLTNDEQKAVKTTVFDLQVNPASPGMQFHKLDGARDPRFWSVRVNLDIRLIVHRTESSLLLCYVGHHEQAYRWAQKRKLETHPKTGAAQLVEVRETVREIAIPKYVEVDEPASPKPLLFADIKDDELLSYGVPPDWLNDVRQADEDKILDVAVHLPDEAAEAVLSLATGVKPQIPQVVPTTMDPFEHPDAQRRFRVMTNIEELERALDYPWEKWTVFLHPAQRELVEHSFNGPARVAGSAGTGKTVVAIHRAVFLAKENPKAKVLLTTFSDTLANALRVKLKRLIGNEPQIFERVDVRSIGAVGQQCYTDTWEEPSIADEPVIRRLLADASAKAEAHRFSPQFFWTEWNDVVDAWQLDRWEAYRDVARLGRKTRSGEKQRQLLWGIFDSVRTELEGRDMLTVAGLFARLTTHLENGGQCPYDFAVIDEAQDVNVPKLRFLAALGATKTNGLFFAGDLGQRIFQSSFSWKSLGVDIRGRSRTLRINYRTSHQIRHQADRLLPPELSDVDGNTENRRGTISVFNGPEPVIRTFEETAMEAEAVSKWLSSLLSDGLAAHEIGVFVRSTAQIDRAKQALQIANLASLELQESFESQADHVSISTMHLAKGLEFRAVAVMACDDEVIPLQERIASIADDADLEDVYNTERHLLYVACTRARDHLLITSVAPASEFLDDLNMLREYCPGYCGSMPDSERCQ